MKIRKLFICFVLVILVYSMFITAFAASTDSEEAVFLSKNGILVGANGDLMLDQKFTVEQLMTVLARVMGEDETARNYPKPPSFTDVPKDRWSAPYIAWAEAKGFAKGNGDGTIGYLDNVNTQRLSMFLLRVLGYNEVPWNKAYDTAFEKGLLSKVDVSADEQVIRGDVAKIVFSALSAENNEGIVLGDKLGVELPTIEQNSENKTDLIYDLSLFGYRSNTGSKIGRALYFMKTENEPWMTRSFTYANNLITGGIEICSGDAEDGTQRIMTFNSDGKLLDITIHFGPEEKQLTCKEHYEWSEEKGQNILIPEKWETCSPKPERKNIYDNNGRLIESRTMFGTRTIEHSDFTVTYETFPQEIWSYTYDSNGRILEARIWRDSGLFTASKDRFIKYKCDELGNIIEEYHYYDGKLENKIKYTYAYDDKGRIEDITQYDFSGGNTAERPFTEADEPKDLYSRDHFSYDQDNSLIERLHYGRQSQLINRTKYEYE